MVGYIKSFLERGNGMTEERIVNKVIELIDHEVVNMSNESRPKSSN